MSTIYDLDDKYFSLWDSISSLDEEDDEKINGLFQEIEQNEEGYQHKMDSYVAIIRMLESYVDAEKAEEKRLHQRRQGFEKKIKWMKDNMKASLERRGERKVKTAFNTINIRKNPLSLNVMDTSHIPKEYFTPQEPKLNKRDLLNYIKETGETFAGVELVQSESLQISKER